MHAINDINMPILKLVKSDGTCTGCYYEKEEPTGCKEHRVACNNGNRNYVRYYDKE